MVAIDKSTGTELWRAKVKGAMWVTILIDGKRIYAGANGVLFCLDAGSGHVLWHNKLKKLGSGIISFSGDGAAGISSASAAATAAMA